MKACFPSLDILITGQNVSLLRPVYTEHRCRHIVKKLRLRFLKGKSLFLAIGNCEIKPDSCDSTFIGVLDAPPLAVSSLFSPKVLSTSRHTVEMSIWKIRYTLRQIARKMIKDASRYSSKILSGNDIVSSFSSLFRISLGREEDLDLLRVTGTGRPYLSDPAVSKQSWLCVNKRRVGFKKKSK